MDAVVMEAEAMAATKAAEVKVWTTVVGWASRRAVARGMGQRRGRRQVERVERKSATLGALVVLPAAAAFREHVEAVTFFCRCIRQQTEASDIIRMATDIRRCDETDSLYDIRAMLSVAMV